MDTDWRRIAAAVKARREALHLTQAEAATKGGLSEPSWNVLENARGKSYKSRTLRGVTIALDWPADAIERIGQGEDASAFEPAQIVTAGIAPDVLRQLELGVSAPLLRELDHLRERLEALERRLAALAWLPRLDEGTIGRASAQADVKGPTGSDAWLAEYRKALDALAAEHGASTQPAEDPARGSPPAVAADTGQPSARVSRRVKRPSPTQRQDPEDG
jgi:transcriptional regulator with XRE-family HTH domain